jgi:hypothetical protein
LGEHCFGCYEVTNLNRVTFVNASDEGAEIHPAEVSAESLGNGTTLKVDQNLFLATLLADFELDLPSQRWHDRRQIADARNGCGFTGDGCPTQG